MRALALDYLNEPRFRGDLSANTYIDHPPGWHLDETSVDFWGEGGRGFPIGSAVRRELAAHILGDPRPPFIRWMISGGGMWLPGRGWGPAPAGPAGSDAGHFNHIHVTFR